MEKREATGSKGRLLLFFHARDAPAAGAETKPTERRNERERIVIYLFHRMAQHTTT